jgi:hypothetical protein
MNCRGRSTRCRRVATAGTLTEFGKFDSRDDPPLRPTSGVA